MPRKPKGPRLYLRSRKGRERTWVILDGTVEAGTGCGEADFGKAQKALEKYLVEKHRPEWRKGDPSEVAIADILSHYAEQRAPELVAPQNVGYHMTPLLAFFGEKTCDFIDKASCASYRRGRMSGKIGRRKVTEGTARRELETLQAALNYAHGDKKLIYPVVVTKPKKSPRRERWLTRSELASLVAGALGIVPVASDIKTRKPVKMGRMFKPAYHVARFILIGVYTATRHDAILQMRWGVNSSGGWFDLPHRMMYRKGYGQAETNKRRPPAAIPENIFPHLERWKRITKEGPVEYAGRLLQKERRGFTRARDLAGLGAEVTPHVLKHTCITWMLQRDVPIWQVAGFTGTSEQMIRRVYGHQSPDHTPAATKRFHGRNLG